MSISWRCLVNLTFFLTEESLTRLFSFAFLFNGKKGINTPSTLCFQLCIMRQDNLQPQPSRMKLTTSGFFSSPGYWGPTSLCPPSFILPWLSGFDFTSIAFCLIPSWPFLLPLSLSYFSFSFSQHSSLHLIFLYYVFVNSWTVLYNVF